jgi:DNA-binding NarL/FixJ family response regulator
LRAARTIRAELPGTGVLVLSQYAEEAYAVDLLGESAEGVGYLLKDRVADSRGFADSVRQVGQGGSALDPEVVAQMLSRPRDSSPLEGSHRVSATFWRRWPRGTPIARSPTSWD